MEQSEHYKMYRMFLNHNSHQCFVMLVVSFCMFLPINEYKSFGVFKMLIGLVDSEHAQFSVRFQFQLNTR